MMDLLAWLGWALAAVLGVLWSLVWFLISGWISTLLQIAVLVATIYFLKYGWSERQSRFGAARAHLAGSSGAGSARGSLKRAPKWR